MLATDDRHTVCLTDVQGPMIIIPATCTLLLPWRIQARDLSMAVSHGSGVLHAERPQGRDGEGAGAGSYIKLNLHR